MTAATSFATTSALSRVVPVELEGAVVNAAGVLVVVECGEGLAIVAVEVAEAVPSVASQEVVETHSV